MRNIAGSRRHYSSQSNLTFRQRQTERARSRKSRLSHWLRITGVFVGASLIVAAIAEERRWRASANAPVGRLTGAQAIQKARPIVSHLVQEDRDMVIAAEPVCVWTNGALAAATWDVMLWNRDGQERADVIFDAYTGDLQTAVRLTPPDPGMAHLAEARDAEIAAKNWMEFVSGAGSPYPWAMSSATLRLGHWAVRLSRAGRWATVTVDRRTGTVLAVTVGRSKQPILPSLPADGSRKRD